MFICLLSAYRKKNKISQEDFCKLLGLSRKTLSSIENGKEPGLFIAFKCSQILNASLYELWKPILQDDIQTDDF